MTQTVSILNVGHGDTKLTFDVNNPAESIRAARIVKDMIRRGYALLVEDGERDGKPVYRRVYEFDVTKCEYIIADLDPEQAAKADQEEANSAGFKSDAAESAATSKSGARGKKGPKARGEGPGGVPTKRVSAYSTAAVAVGRSAGG